MRPQLDREGMIYIPIFGSGLNNRSYRREREFLPDVGDLFRDDGDVVTVIAREWNAYGEGLYLHCETAKESMFR